MFSVTKPETNLLTQRRRSSCLHATIHHPRLAVVALPCPVPFSALHPPWPQRLCPRLALLHPPDSPWSLLPLASKKSLYLPPFLFLMSLLHATSDTESPLGQNSLLKLMSSWAVLELRDPIAPPHPSVPLCPSLLVALPAPPCSCLHTLPGDCTYLTGHSYHSHLDTSQTSCYNSAENSGVAFAVTDCAFGTDVPCVSPASQARQPFLPPPSSRPPQVEHISKT